MKKTIAMTGLLLLWSTQAMADAFDDCVLEVSERSGACSEEAMTFSDPVNKLKNAVCDVNFHVIENIDHALCFIQHKLEFADADITAKDVDGVSYDVDFEETPTEAFATSEGYTKKISISAGGEQVFVAYWDGEGADTKGFLISNKLGVELDNELAIYIQWDKTTTDQWLQYVRGTWDAAVNTDGPMDSNGGTINAGKYGYFSYDATASVINDLQILWIAGDPTPMSTNLDCTRVRIWGSADEFVGFYNGPDFGGSPAEETSTNVDETDLDGGTLYDASGAETGTPVTDFAATVGGVTGPGDFNKSCNDLYETRVDTSVFSYTDTDRTTYLNFEATPADIF